MRRGGFDELCGYQRSRGGHFETTTTIVRRTFIQGRDLSWMCLVSCMRSMKFRRRSESKGDSEEEEIIFRFGEVTLSPHEASKCWE